MNEYVPKITEYQMRIAEEKLKVKLEIMKEIYGNDIPEKKLEAYKLEVKAEEKRREKHNKKRSNKL